VAVDKARARVLLQQAADLGVLPCVAVCCGVLQRVVLYGGIGGVAVDEARVRVLLQQAADLGVLQCVAVCCGVLCCMGAPVAWLWIRRARGCAAAAGCRCRCATVCCRMLQCVVLYGGIGGVAVDKARARVLLQQATDLGALQYFALCCVVWGHGWRGCE